MSPARTSPLTRVIFQVHLWGGLALGIYAFLIGLTGSVLVFHEEIRQQMSPPLSVVESTEPPRLGVIRAGVQAHYPDLYPWSLEAPWEAGDPWSSWVQWPGGGKMVYADATGRVIGEMTTDGTWLAVFERFHSVLLLPRGGRLVNGLAGLGVVVVGLSGLVLWWPARGGWNTAFQIVRRSGWKGLVFDLHRVGGVLTLGFVVLFGLTGAYFTWASAYRQIVAAVLPTTPVAPVVRIDAEGPQLPIDELVASAQRALPGARLVRVLMPSDDRQPVTVVLAYGETRADRQMRTSQLTIHPHTAVVLAIDDYRQRRAGDHLIAWLGPLHTGNFSGMMVKVWAVGGLTLPALFVTGFLMWNNRILVPRLRQRRRR
jgi:uncharacterized iron-regulated membrane protein